jgi:hypothetical protein
MAVESEEHPAQTTRRAIRPVARTALGTAMRAAGDASCGSSVDVATDHPVGQPPAAEPGEAHQLHPGALAS